VNPCSVHKHVAKAVVTQPVSPLDVFESRISGADGSSNYSVRRGVYIIVEMVWAASFSVGRMTVLTRRTVARSVERCICKAAMV
jgi:hypothetical protein